MTVCAAPKSRADLMAFLAALDIAPALIEHPAVFTVDEGRSMKLDWPGGHSKNLFLKDKGGALYLVSARAETAIDLVGLGKRLGAKGRLSFGKPELMRATLGVIPGAVTPYALINAQARMIARFVLDRNLLAHNPIWFHPLENIASLGVSPPEFLKFLKALDVEPLIVDCAHPLAP